MIGALRGLSALVLLAGLGACIGGGPSHAEIEALIVAQSKARIESLIDRVQAQGGQDRAVLYRRFGDPDTFRISSLRVIRRDRDDRGNWAVLLSAEFEMGGFADGLRQDRQAARITVVPEDKSWKLLAFERL